MRKLLVLPLALLLLASVAPIARTDDSMMSLVRVKVDSPEQAAYLMSHFDESHNHADQEIELLLWPGDRSELDALGYDYRVMIPDMVAYELGQATRPHPPVKLPGPDYTDYRRLTDYNRELQELADDNPKLVEFFEMERLSLEGRPIYGIEIAPDVRNHDDGRPIFYIDGVHHAREWPASEYTMIFAHYLVEKYGKDPQVTKLLDSTRVILVPIVNVDGFDYSRESVASMVEPLRDPTSVTGFVNGFEGYWRKNRRSLTGVTVPAAQRNPDAFGVDNNRNYSFLWGDQQGGSSNDVFSQTYRGAAPFSEPENLNVQDILLGRSVTGVISNHTYQGTVLRAGGGLAPDEATLVAIGDKIAAAMGYRNVPSVGYPTTGTTDDWAYAAMGSLGFTIEHGVINFHPAYAEEVGAHHKDVMKGFLIAAEMAANPSYHSILKGKVTSGGKPVAATLQVTKSYKVPLSEGNPIGEEFYAEKISNKLKVSDGSFVWHMGPSVRPYEEELESFTLVIKAGGKTKTITVLAERGKTIDLGTIAL